MIHIGHRRSVVNVLFPKQLHVDVPIDTACASPVTSKVADTSGTRVSSRTSWRSDEHGNIPMSTNEKGIPMQREGTQDGENGIETNDQDS